MRNRFPELLVMAGLVIGCSRSAPMPAPAPAAIEPTAALTCQSPKRLCTGCNGGQFCALRCPECAPSAAAIPEELDATPVAAVVCKPPQRLCPTCTDRRDHAGGRELRRTDLQRRNALLQRELRYLHGQGRRVHAAVMQLSDAAMCA